MLACSPHTINMSNISTKGNYFQEVLLDKLKLSLRKLYGLHHDLVDRYGISVSQMTTYVPLVVNTFRSFPRSLLITGFVTRLTRRVSLVKPQLLTQSTNNDIQNIHIKLKIE
jgi:hypothetical protein